MSVAEKYGRAIESLSADALSQVRSAGQSLIQSGVVQQSSLGSGAPAPTPAVKFGAQAESNAIGRSLAQEAPSRSL